MIPQFTIEKRNFGYRVTSEPDPMGMVKKLFLGKGNTAFSKAVGYATNWAAKANGKLIDQTGRLSEQDCADFVAAMRP
ncbi:hypothetical protein [Qipengyuania spongiae]|uniref:Uncharacterized protein n=1 Tax=Qipengyuania spongiae TaxID=2909673 RepID=A0ABY5T168_9SPHN|nr:hypothetical protein [Qipengyuania spongiae]UVI39249.1 hypothetical protein L1F33_13615 [Qipengyuania spongiae]